MRKTTSNKKADKSEKKSEFVVGEPIGKPIILEKGKKNTVRVHHVTVGGEPMIDIRKYVKNERYDGHTMQGVTLSYPVFEELRKTLDNLSLELDVPKKKKKK